MKVAILYLNTWWGHKSNSKAIQSGILEKFPDAEVVLFDPLENNKALIRLILEGWWKIATENDYANTIFRMIYEINTTPIIMNHTINMITLNIQTILNTFFKNAWFTDIISTHFLLNKAIIKSIGKYALNAKFTTIVTDPFSPHPIRFANKWYQYIVFSQQAKEIWLSKKIPSKDIHIFSTIIDQKFTKKLSPQEILSYKTKYWISENERCVLVIWWGEWIPNWEKLLKKILDYPTLIGTKYIFVCGKNKVLQAKLLKIVKKKNRESDFIILWFTHEVYERMNASDVIMSKWWPATIFEALSLQKPLIIYSYAGPQEIGNVEFLDKKKLWIFQKDYSLIPSTINELLSDKKLQDKFKKNIKKLAYHNGLQEIISFITK